MHNYICICSTMYFSMRMLSHVRLVFHILYEFRFRRLKLCYWCKHRDEYFMFEVSGLIRMMLVMCTSCIYTCLTKGGHRRLHPPQSEFWVHCFQVLRSFVLFPTATMHYLLVVLCISTHFYCSINEPKWATKVDLPFLDIFLCLYHDSYLLSCISKL